MKEYCCTGKEKFIVLKLKSSFYHKSSYRDDKFCEIRDVGKKRLNRLFLQYPLSRALVDTLNIIIYQKKGC